MDEEKEQQQETPKKKLRFPTGQEKLGES